MYYASCLGSSRRGEELPRPRKRRVSPVCCAGVELGLGKGGGGVLKKDATRRRRANNKRFSPTAEFPRKLLTEVRRQIQKYFVMETRPWEIKYRDEEDEVARPPHTTDFFFRKEGIRNDQSRINSHRIRRTNELASMYRERKTESVSVS